MTQYTVSLVLCNRGDDEEDILHTSHDLIAASNFFDKEVAKQEELETKYFWASHDAPVFMLRADGETVKTSMN